MPNSGGNLSGQGGNGGSFWDIFGLGLGSGGDNSRVVIDNNNNKVPANVVAQANV